MAENLSGKSFHRLTVLELHSTRIVGKKRPRKEYRWRCRCICGKERIVPSCHLKSGHSKSCGCWKIEQMRLPNPQQSQMNVAYAQHKHGAARRGILSNLSFEQWLTIVQQPCVYCGDTNTCEKKPDARNNYGESFFCNGVDRVNNSVGYTLDNSVPCCSVCNFMKWNLDVEVFLDQCQKIVQYASTPAKPSANSL